jgi:hypothetical protein
MMLNSAPHNPSKIVFVLTVHSGVIDKYDEEIELLAADRKRLRGAYRL